jgi:hypothetical protein
MISRMAKPEEVLIVEDENGEIVRETMKVQCETRKHLGCARDDGGCNNATSGCDCASCVRRAMFGKAESFKLVCAFGFRVGSSRLGSRCSALQRLVLHCNLLYGVQHVTWRAECNVVFCVATCCVALRGVATCDWRAVLQRGMLRCNALRSVATGRTGW